MEKSDAIVRWLLEGDPAIRWQTLRDLTAATPRAVARQRACVATSGWGARLLAAQGETGLWGGGLYTPKWTSTTYTLLLLRDMGLAPRHPQALKGCRLLLDRGLYEDGGINLSRSWKRSETCITAMVLSICAQLGFEDPRLESLAQYVLREQMPDGGWNCQRHRGATHSSFHTTISALEALLHFGRCDTAQRRGREFLLMHRLFRSHRTGEVVNPVLMRFAFPPRWHYDILRALDHFRDAGGDRDPRLAEGIAIVEKRRLPDGRWLLPALYPGAVHFQMEPPGAPSRWNTMRALRVLQWWHAQ